MHKKQQRLENTVRELLLNLEQQIADRYGPYLHTMEPDEPRYRKYCKLSEICRRARGELEHDNR